MEFITYGCGNKFKPEKFKPIENRSNKPTGGMWGSLVGTEYGWKKWCEAEDYNLECFDTTFKFKIDGNILIIDKKEDLNELTWLKDVAFNEIIDFEIVAFKWDAIILTENGQRETRMSHPKNLYGWDCECILVLNGKSVIPT